MTRDSRSPRLMENYPVVESEEESPSWEMKNLCAFEKFLVINEQSDELFVVGRYIVDSDGNYVPEIFYGPEMGFNDHLPSKTVAFVVHKYDPETRSLRYIDRSLDGLAFFTGPCDGFALSAADFPELKLNSIYFTDVYSPPCSWWHDSYGGHDLGIFSYEDASLSPCYYPCDARSIKRITPAPVWLSGLFIFYIYELFSLMLIDP